MKLNRREKRRVKRLKKAQSACKLARRYYENWIVPYPLSYTDVDRAQAEFRISLLEKEIKRLGG